jgi:signal transduction histidine kinase
MQAARALPARDRWVVGAVATIGLAALALGLFGAEFETRRTVETQALQTALRITEAASAVLNFGESGTYSGPEPALRDAVLTLLKRISSVERMVVIDRNRRVWLDSENLETGDSEADEDIADVLGKGEPLSLLHVAAGGFHVLGVSANHEATAEIYVPVRRQGVIVGAFEFYIDMTEQFTDAARIARSAYLAFAAAIAVGMSAILTLVWRSLRRRRRDIQALDEMRRRAEFASKELEIANQHQARFNANAAHELRTPLSILKARLEAMAPEPDVLALRAEVDGMIRQIGLLLELARTETGTSEPHRPIDLSGAARDTVAQLYPMFRKMGRGVVMDAPERPVVVVGDATLVQTALRNLLENALRVSPIGAEVLVQVKAHPASLSVCDRGPGLDPAELEALIEPFRRGKLGGAAGLGLAIVAEAAKHLSARLELTRREGGGAIFSLIFAPPLDGAQ